MQTNRALREIPEFDGLRGFAILWVIGFHLSGNSPAAFGWLSGVYWALAPGWAGVDLFFVLSGFLITTILLNTRESPRFLRSFYGRRVLRIFPLYFLALALFFYLELPLREMHFGMRTNLRAEEIWYWTYLINWHDPLGKIIEPLSHFWSLAVEEQFYFVWPPAVWLCTRKPGLKQVTWLCVGSILLSIGLRAVLESTGMPWEVMHRFTLTRFDTLAMGGLLAVAVRTPEAAAGIRSRLQYIAAAVLALFVLNEYLDARVTFPLHHTLRYTLTPLLFGCVVFSCFDRSGGSGLLERIARWPWLRSVGKYSYSMYVFHMLAMRYLIVPVVKFELRAGLALPVAFTLGLVISAVATYLVGVLTWHAYEKHFLKLKRYFPYGHDKSAGIAIGIAAGSQG